MRPQQASSNGSWICCIELQR